MRPCNGDFGAANGSALAVVVCVRVRVTAVAARIAASMKAPTRRCAHEIILPEESLLDTKIRRARMLRQVGRSPGLPR